MIWRSLLAALVISVTGSTAGVADGKYYMIIFASETSSRRPQTSHTFACFVRVGDASESDKQDFEVHTISWLPFDGAIRLLRGPVAGKNIDLAATFEYARNLGATVIHWGPFPIKKELYDRARARIDWLNSGRVAFASLDRRYRGGSVVNCIHAVSDLDADSGFVSTGRAHGAAASAMVARHLEKWTMPTREDLAWVKELVGIRPSVTRGGD